MTKDGAGAGSGQAEGGGAARHGALVGGAPALSALEQAIGMPLGCDSAVAEVAPSRRESPWEALVETFVPLLKRADAHGTFNNASWRTVLPASISTVRGNDTAG